MRHHFYHSFGGPEGWSKASDESRKEKIEMLKIQHNDVALRDVYCTVYSCIFDGSTSFCQATEERNMALGLCAFLCITKIDVVRSPLPATMVKLNGTQVRELHRWTTAMKRNGSVKV